MGCSIEQILERKRYKYIYTIIMISRIEIHSTIFDTRADSKRKKLSELGFKKKVKKVYLADIYTIEKKVSNSQLQKILIALIDSLVQKADVNKPFIPPSFTWAVEVGYLPGVTDNIANTAKELIENLLKISFKNDEGVYTSQTIFIDGIITEEEILTIANSFYNPIIQRVAIKSAQQYKKRKRDGNYCSKSKT